MIFLCIFAKKMKIIEKRFLFQKYFKSLSDMNIAQNEIGRRYNTIAAIRSSNTALTCIIHKQKMSF